MADDLTQYDLAELRFADKTIPCESFTLEFDNDTDVRNVTNSHDPAGYKSGKRSYKFTAKTVDPNLGSNLKKYWYNGTIFTTGCYTFAENGKYTERDVLMDCKITKVSVNTDDGYGFDIEGIALSMKMS